jgi:hypothetical protein
MLATIEMPRMAQFIGAYLNIEAPTSYARLLPPTYQHIRMDPYSASCVDGWSYATATAPVYGSEMCIRALTSTLATALKKQLRPESSADHRTRSLRIQQQGGYLEDAGPSASEVACMRCLRPVNSSASIQTRSHPIPLEWRTPGEGGSSIR